MQSRMFHQSSTHPIKDVKDATGIIILHIIFIVLIYSMFHFVAFQNIYDFLIL